VTKRQFNVRKHQNLEKGWPSWWLHSTKNEDIFYQPIKTFKISI